MANSSSSSDSKGTGFLSSYLSTTKPTDFYTGKFNFGDAFKNVDPSPKSWNHSIDWKNYNKDTDFSSVYNSDTTGMFKGLFDKAKDTDKYRKWSEKRDDQEKQGAESSMTTQGKASQVLDNLAAVYPHVTTIQQPGSSGFGGALGTLAGIGASFIPGLGPGIAAAMPAIGGTIGGMFG